MRKINLFRKNSPASFMLALIIGVLLAVGGSVLATSIGSDVSVTGTLSVTGASTLTGNVTASADATVTSGARVGTGSDGTHLTALADDSLFVEGTGEFDGIVWFDASLRASSTALFTSGITTYGSDTLGDAAGDALTVNATTTVVNGITTQGGVVFGDASTDQLSFVSGTLVFNNVGTSTIVDSNANSWAYATSSSAGPAFVKFNTAAVFVGIATNTPSATLDIGGDGSLAVTAATGTATSSLRLQSRGTTRGGCIELESVDGSATFRLYATATTNTNQGGIGYAPAVFELGSCR